MIPARRSVAVARQGFNREGDRIHDLAGRHQAGWLSRGPSANDQTGADDRARCGLRAAVPVRCGRPAGWCPRCRHRHLAMGANRLCVVCAAGAVACRPVSHRGALRRREGAVAGVRAGAAGAVLAVAFFVVKASGWWTLPSTSVVIFWARRLRLSGVFACDCRCTAAHRCQETRGASITLAIYGLGDAGVQFAPAMPIPAASTDRCASSMMGRIVYAGRWSDCRSIRPTALLEAVERHDVAQVVVAIPSTSSARRRELIAKIRQSAYRSRPCLA